MIEIPPPLKEYQQILDHDEFVVLINELIDSFMETAPAHLDQLKLASGSGDEVAFKRAAHTLKSSGDTFGLLEFRRIAAELETKGCQKNSDNINALISRLEIEYAKAKSYLLAIRRKI
jgi:HPt (histidine-containing phosphotransfer) domain-containing protein